MPLFKVVEDGVVGNGPVCISGNPQTSTYNLAATVTQHAL
jgi:hypothetical protein